MNYRTVIAELKKLDKGVERDAWRRAHLAWQARNEFGGSIAQIARDVGRGRTTVTDWIAAWDRWGDEQPVTRGTFYERLAELRGQTVDSVRTRGTIGHVKNLPVTERAKIVKEALKDERVLREVVADRQTSRAFGVAEASHALARSEGRDDGVADVVRGGQDIRWIADLDNMRQRLARMARDCEDAKPRNRKGIARAAQGVESAAAMLKTLLLEGHIDDDELEKLLAGGI